MDLENTFILEEPGRGKKFADPCILVIFGATGDLTHKKLFPALYNLGVEGLLPSNFAIVSFARRDKKKTFHEEIRKCIESHTRLKPFNPLFWDHFRQQIVYHQASLDDDLGYQSLKDLLSELDFTFKTRQNRIFYLATPPKYFPIVIEKLAKNGLIYDSKQESEKWSRVIIEKPFGRDLMSAKKLQKHLSQFLEEDQIYRIDHYLGKETVQNLLVFRFTNPIIESLWNHRHIDHVQITVAEKNGINTRGHFFDEQGIIRDVMQNHLMQLLALIAMEVPHDLSSKAIRKEKVRIMKSICCPRKKLIRDNIVIGQYDEGYIDGHKVPSYREESDIPPYSTTETYCALKLKIPTKRWKNVSFYLRVGKRLPKRTTEIAIVFKKFECTIFDRDTMTSSNVLTLRIQPDEGIALKINAKVPGQNNIIQSVMMDFKYGSYFGHTPPDAYERLLLDCMLGDNSLFIGNEEVMHAWRVFTPILRYLSQNPSKIFPNYHAGCWGPKEADDLIEKDKRKWRMI
ncbi:MAG: glucose-6-phosphate dehydrogenase [Parachlamydiales bacterium]|nr:glucose-6-phosphate dehydrogenase [Parachlamydiales bacterium]